MGISICYEFPRVRSSLLFQNATAVITQGGKRLEIRGLVVTAVQDNSGLPAEIREQHTVDGHVPTRLSATADTGAIRRAVSKDERVPDLGSLIVTLDSGKVFDYRPLNSFDLVGGPSGELWSIVCWGPQMCLSQVVIETPNWYRGEEGDHEPVA